MAKYTEEQLIELKDEAHIPHPTILDAFNKMIEEVQQQTLAQYQEFQQQQQQYQLKKKHNGDTYIDENGNERSYHHMNRRRGSRSGGTKPNLRKKNEVVQVDEDGWATTVQPTTKPSNEEDSFSKSNVGFKARPNNKNLGSSKAVDPREIASDKQTKAFNAFAALGGSDEEEEDDDDDNDDE